MRVLSVGEHGAAARIAFLLHIGRGGGGGLSGPETLEGSDTMVEAADMFPLYFVRMVALDLGLECIIPACLDKLVHTMDDGRKSDV